MKVDSAYLIQRLGITMVQLQCAKLSGRIPDKAEWELGDIEIYLKPWERALKAKRQSTDRDRAYSCVTRTVQG
jgi:hypothetical protein